MTLKEKIKLYYELTKPGIIYGNLITTAGGFLLAAKGHWHLLLLLEDLVGIALVMAAGCVINNYIDRGIDAKMERTKNRALVTGEISGRSAIIYGIILGALGFAVLGYFTNALTVLIALLGTFVYVVLYAIFKRKSVSGTLIGAVSGAVPPLVGYCAATNRFDAGAVIIFLILLFWQMPHFYAISIYRQKEYAAAGIPLMSVKRGIRATKISMIFYILAFAASAIALSIFGYAGYTYLGLAILLSAVWLVMGLHGFSVAPEREYSWARGMFFYSLMVLIILFIMMAVSGIVNKSLV